MGEVVIADNTVTSAGVVLAQRIEQLANPGGLCITAAIHEALPRRMPYDQKNLGEQHLKGFDEQIRVYAVNLISGTTIPEPETPLQVEAEALNLPEKPSIAVLPFQNMSGDAEQEYFADGIAEDIITTLSRFPWFFVISRNSSFSYKGASPDVRAVGKELGVKYVLEGSVRKGGNRVRITAQLIDATTGKHVWAERYDRELDDIFAVQDEITEAITGAVVPSFVAVEARRAGRKAPESLDSWDLIMRGNWHLWPLSKEGLAAAHQLFKAAIDLDPDSHMAHSGLAMAVQLAVGAGLADDIEERQLQSKRAAERALALNDQDALAHLALAMVSHVSRDNRAAMAFCRKALDLNPNFSFAEGLMALVHAHLGDYDEANKHLDREIRLSPRDPTISMFSLARVIAALIAELPEEYLERAKEFTDTSPQFVAGWRHVAVAYIMHDRPEQAKDAIEKVLRLSPGDSLESVRRAIPISNVDVRERFLECLSKAGLPEK